MNASKTVAKRRAERCMVALCRSRLSSTCLHYLQAANTRSQIESSNYSVCIILQPPSPTQVRTTSCSQRIYHAIDDTVRTVSSMTMRIRTLTTLVLAGGRVWRCASPSPSVSRNSDRRLLYFCCVIIARIASLLTCLYLERHAVARRSRLMHKALIPNDLIPNTRQT